MTGKFPKAPKIPFSIVDVRDMATAHINAIEKGKNGTRYLTNIRKESFFFIDITLLLSKEFKDTKYKIPTSEAGSCLFKMLSICDKRLKPFVPVYGLKYEVDDQKTREELGVTYRTLDESVIEMAHNLIDLGYMEDFRKK